MCTHNQCSEHKQNKTKQNKKKKKKKKKKKNEMLFKNEHNLCLEILGSTILAP